MGNTGKYISGFLAVTSLLGLLAAVGFLAYGVVPEANHDFFNMGLVALIGFVSTAFGYYLGSSEGSARKNDIIANHGTKEDSI